MVTKHAIKEIGKGLEKDDIVTFEFDDGSTWETVVSQKTNHGN
eukprot:gene5072-15304_t